MDSRERPIICHQSGADGQTSKRHLDHWDADHDALSGCAPIDQVADINSSGSS